MEEKDFIEKYWYDNTKIISVINPRSEDFIFQSTVETGIDPATGKLKAETRKYRVPAGGEERFPGPIANMYLDQMTKLLAQDENKIHFLIDFALKAQYYDQLTVAIEDLIHDYQPFPEYLDKPEEKAAIEPEEQAFAEVKPEETRRKPGRPAKTATEA